MSKGNVVVVIGPGRSGTSLVMQLLSAQGMAVDALRSKLDTSNPQGDYEDQEIAEVHEEIFDILGISPLFPRDIARTEFVKITAQVERLKQIVSIKALVKNSVWGFKDPRTSSLLPIWEIIFRELDLQPKYILCMRNPGAVISSMKEHFSRGEAVSELLWLTRTCDSITNCGKDLFVVHYEDWFVDKDKAKALATGMLNFASLSVEGLDSTLESLVKPNLNRSASTYIPANPDVVKMYQALKELPSGEPVPDSIMQMAREYKATADFYVAVSSQANAKVTRKLKFQADEQKRQLEERMRALETEVKEHSEAKAELETRVNRQGKQRKLLEENQLALEGKITSLESEISALNDKRMALELRVAEQSNQLKVVAKGSNVLEQRIADLTNELTSLTEVHRKATLHLKAASDENDKLRIQIKTSKEMLASVQRPKAVERKVGPAKAIQRKAELPPLTPAQRKMRKLMRTPGMFFKDWYAAKVK